ncbi:DUF2486 family protein [Caballeronia telluris]|nr:DUF2486 family protein [Caballeronia telluris]
MSKTPEEFDTSIPVLTEVVMPGKAQYARTPGQGTPAPAHGTDYDAEFLAERLHGRFTNFLTGDGRELIESRCRDALREHSTWLVHQITREVALALEAEMTDWVREAVDEELQRRRSA